MMIFQFIFIALAILLSIPLLVIGFELLVTLFHKTSVDRDLSINQIQDTYKILIPAHNEAEIIANTLTKLLEQKVLAESIILVADNCTDTTAAIARTFGVTVLERFNNELRGKGFALDYGVTFLKEHTPPDVLVIFDADCEINNGGMNLLVSHCLQHSCPVQALYLMKQNGIVSMKQRVAEFAWLVKNKLRPIAVNKLGLPVTLTGTGMAFPWPIIATVDLAHGNIVEDMQLGIDCALKGFSPVFCEQSVVYSNFPEQLEAESSQRTRWEHGHLMTISQQVPKLINIAIKTKDWRLLGLGLDLAVPPLALLVIFSFLSLMLFAGFASYSDRYEAVFILLLSFILFSVTLMITWWQFGRSYLTLKELCSVPLYILSKISIYVGLVFKPQKAWVKTARKDHL